MKRQFTITHTIGNRVLGHVMADDAGKAVQTFVAAEGYSVAVLKAVATQEGGR